MAGQQLLEITSAGSTASFKACEGPGGAAASITWEKERSPGSCPHFQAASIFNEKRGQCQPRKRRRGHSETEKRAI